MNWQPIESAPKDYYCLGFDPHLKRPVIMAWNEKKKKFAVNNGYGDETPTLWMPLVVDWKPVATAPKDVYCLGYDESLKRPFVMLWNVAEGEFVPACGLGDEVPAYWAELPAIPSLVN